MKYRIRYNNGFYYLEERRKWLFIPFWYMISASKSLGYIEEVYNKLIRTKANNETSNSKCGS